MIKNNFFCFEFYMNGSLILCSQMDKGDSNIELD